LHKKEKEKHISQAMCFALHTVAWRQIFWTPFWGGVKWLAKRKSDSSRWIF